MTTRGVSAIVFVLGTLLLAVGAAHASGSSMVTSKSPHFVVGIESVRKIFAEDSGNAEGKWHKGWRTDHQREVDKLKRALAKLIETPEQLTTLALIPYDDKLPELIDEQFDDYPERLTKPFRCHYREGSTHLTVAYKKKPTAAQQKALRRLFAGAIERIRGDN